MEGLIRRDCSSSFALIALSLLLVCDSNAQSREQIVGGGCDGCEAIFAGMPKGLSWETTIHDAKEPGEPPEISGTLYQADGKTPAANVILYVYHTDAKGLYSPAPGATGLARRHGHLRGWMQTDERGQYKFHSIKPAPYPARTDPAHFHPIVKETDKNEYYMDEYVFDDDPLVTKEYRARREHRGGSGIIKLVKNQRGIWAGRSDIVLGQNIPNYP